MQIRRPTSGREQGDTIVEVLIAIAVVSMVLGGAYATTHRSLLATRAAQERSNALKLGQSQLEQLKGVIATNPNTIFGVGVPSPFCITPANTVVQDTNAACAVDTSGAPATVQPVFHLSMIRSGNQFAFTESWTDVGGKQTDQLLLTYRAYQ